LQLRLGVVRRPPRPGWVGAVGHDPVARAGRFAVRPEAGRRPAVPGTNVPSIRADGRMRAHPEAVSLASWETKGA